MIGACAPRETTSERRPQWRPRPKETRGHSAVQEAFRFGRLALLLALVLATSGCAARWAYRQGRGEAQKGNWDLAVARFTRALQRDRDNIAYKIALEDARVQASRQHYQTARQHLAADKLEEAADELQIAAQYDPSNRSVADDVLIVRERIQRRDEERRRLAEFEGMKARTQSLRVPVPVLSPRSRQPFVLKIDGTIEQIFNALKKVTGVNIAFDPDLHPESKRYSVDLTGVTFEEALDQITFLNRLFYKVVNQNTLIIAQDTPTKRNAYDDNLVRTFYLQNAETKDVEAILKGVIGTTSKIFSNAALNAITMQATPDQLALAERIIEANDKAKGEVMIEVQILEINRNRMRNYGIELANSDYSAGVSLSPVDNQPPTGTLNIRAHLLSSLNLSDFVVQIPSTLLTRFLETESTARSLASPRLRAAEGKKAILKIGTQVAIPTTSFVLPQAGTTTFGPATSFQQQNVGVNLEFTPKLNAGGDIQIELKAEFSELGAAREVSTNLKIPDIQTRSVEGMLRLREGETALLGGLLQNRDADVLRGVLGLQNLPILNNILGSTQKTKDQTEVLISITPHILRAPKITEDDLKPLLVGTHDLTRIPGARPPLFGPEEPGETAPAPEQVGPPVTRVPSRESVPAPLPVPPRTEPPRPGTTQPPEGPPAEPAEPRTTTVFVPAEVTTQVSQVTSLAVAMMEARELVGIELVFSYDPSALEVTDMSPGPLLTLDGASVAREESKEPGHFRVKLTRPSAASGNGVVVSLTLRGLRAGTTVVSLETATIVTSSGPASLPAPPPGRIVVSP